MLAAHFLAAFLSSGVFGFLNYYYYMKFFTSLTGAGLVTGTYYSGVLGAAAVCAAVKAYASFSSYYSFLRTQSYL